MDEPGDHYVQGKKVDIQGHIVCDSIYMDYPQQASPERQKARVAAMSFGEKGMENGYLMGTEFPLGGDCSGIRQW